MKFHWFELNVLVFIGLAALATGNIHVILFFPALSSRGSKSRHNDDDSLGNEYPCSLQRRRDIGRLRQLITRKDLIRPHLNEFDVSNHCL